MKVYIIAYIGEAVMFPAHNKIYRSKDAAKAKCSEMNKERKANNKVAVFCADNWHKELEGNK